ncbi:SPL family radical SAM protein [Halorientalis halophila]|uniref:SPL family radical SAM protein n=1 Tax=Halorientalis halophila TaxID=3108499 RepID=UPI003008B376
MKLTWDTGDSWFERTYALENQRGHVLESFDESPSLDELREAERRHGERIDLWQAGLLCSECSDEINGRFASDPDSDLLCWDCAMDATGDSENGVRVNTDPTKAVMSESQLHKKSLCDHVINVATGCRHGCKFCYVPTTPAVEHREDMLNEQADVDDAQRDWGSYLLYRDDLPERLHRILEDRNPEERKQTDRGRGVVMLSSGTDCYQDRRAAQITRGCVYELIEHEIPVRILTRSPAVVRDLDLFKQAGNLVTVGSSIPSLDAELVSAMEPNAPPPMKRWNALDQLQRAGVSVFVSMSPTYPGMGKYEIDNLLGHFSALGAAVVFHEPINPRGANFEMCLEAAEEVGRDDVVTKLREFEEDRTAWVEYAVEQINTVQQQANRYGNIEVHSWPDDQLVDATSGELSRRLRAMQKAVSPENFDDNERAPDESQQQLMSDAQELKKLL